MQYELRVHVTAPEGVDAGATLTSYLDSNGYRRIGSVHIDSIEQIRAVPEPAAADESEASILRDIRDLLRNRL